MIDDMPLFISKGEMKHMGMKLDFNRDVVVMNGKELKLFCTSTGHYCIPLSNFLFRVRKRKRHFTRT